MVTMHYGDQISFSSKVIGKKQKEIWKKIETLVAKQMKHKLLLILGQCQLLLIMLQRAFKRSMGLIPFEKIKSLKKRSA